MSTKARNLLLITVDEMRGDCAGFTGNAEVSTPRLDELAARGTVLAKHFAPFPKCVPSRCAMQTGRYPHTDGLRTVMEDNHLPTGRPSLAPFLRKQGYETAVLGLNHVWERADFYGEGTRQNKKGAGVVDYTSFTEGPLAEVLEKPWTDPPSSPRAGARDECLLANGYAGPMQRKEATGFSDEARAEQACLYLREVRDPQKPFYLQVNFGKPHPPYTVKEPYYSQYDPARLTPFPHQLPAQAPLPLRAQREWRFGENVTEEGLRELQAIYYGMISYVDALVGEVLDALAECGLQEETVVLFCSDHGDYAGQYGLPEKWDTSLQDCLLHVPGILAGPGIPSGARVEELTEIVDTAPTLLDCLGFVPPPEWIRHGESLLPLLSGKAPGKEAVFAAGGHEAPMRARFNTPVWQEREGHRCKATMGKQLTYQQCPEAMAPARMIRTSDWKLILRETGGHELYHLFEDPHEMNNLYGREGMEAVTLDLMERLCEWTLRTQPDRPIVATVGA